MEKNNFDVAAISDIGGGKNTNQDNLLVKIGREKDGDFGLFVVADGMGGLAHGAMASKIAVNKFNIWWEKDLVYVLKSKNTNILNIIDKELKKIVSDVNREVIDFGKMVGKRVGTTLSVLFIYKKSYIVKHVGDSRIYLVNDLLKLLTMDHSWVAQEIRAGNISAEDARRHPRRNILIQCIGVNSNIDIHEVSGRIKDRDSFLLCSDGFYRLIKASEVFNFINDYNDGIRADLRNIAKELLDLVKERGPKDNITEIIVCQKKT